MANAQTVASNERGDLALVPYYTVRDAWVTGLHIVNTSNRTQVVKLRFRRATDGLNALDFNLVMSPNDVYAGFLSDDENGAISWTSRDTTCTAPATQGNRFTMPPIYRAGAETGYAEIIAMGAASAEMQPIALAARHAAATLTPLDCKAVRSNFFADGAGTAAGATSRKGVENNATTWQAASSAAAIKAGGRNTYEDSGDALKVSYFIRDNATGIEFGDNAVHIAGFIDGASITNQQYSVAAGDLNGLDFPDLNGGVPRADVAATVADERQRGGFNRLRAPQVLGAARLLNEWSANPANGVEMDWVLTLPGQYVMLNVPQYVATLAADRAAVSTLDRAGRPMANAQCPRVSTPDPATGTAPADCDFRDLPVEMSVRAYNREAFMGQAPSGTLVSGPQPPTVSVKTYLPKVANVVSFGGNSVLGQTDANVSRELGQPFGWLSASLRSQGNRRVCDWDGGQDVRAANTGAASAVALKDSMVCSAVGGNVPVIGFAAWSRRVAANPEASYGRIVEHSYQPLDLALARFDLNGDGVISPLDAFVLSNCFGRPSSCNPQADFDNDGTIGPADLGLLTSQYEQTAARSQLLVNASVDLSSGETGRTFSFSAKVVKSAGAAETFQWTTDDGRVFDGQEAKISFSTPGVREVVLRATSSNGASAEESVGVVVFDPDSIAPPELRLPDLPGDVDNNGKVTLRDAHLVSKHASGLESLSGDALKSAEVDFEQGVSSADAGLVSLAVIDGATVPTTLLPEAAYPGQSVTLLTPKLLSGGNSKFTIEVGNSASVQEPLRVVKGYASFMVPLDPTNPGRIDVQPGVVKVRLKQDGNLVETFDLDIKAPLALPADPKQDIIKLLTDIQSLLVLNTSAFGDDLDALGIYGTNKELLLGTMIASQVEVTQGIAEMIALLNKDNSDLADVLMLFGNANGLQELRDELSALLAELRGAAAPGNTLAKSSAFSAMASPFQVCDFILPTYCSTMWAVKAFDIADRIAPVFCAGLGLAARGAVFVPGGIGLSAATTATWLAVCSKIAVGIAVANAALSIIEEFDADLTIEVDKNRLDSGESATIRTSVVFTGFDDICQAWVGIGQRDTVYIAKKLAQKALFKLLRNKIGLKAALIVLQAEDGLPGFLREKLQGVVRTIVSRAGWDSIFETLTSAICERYNVGAPLTANASRVLTSLGPGQGALTFNPDGTASYQCPGPIPQGFSPVTITAQKDICGQAQQKSATLSCTAGTGTVTITMGDDGSVNDDIFEVQVNGRTVLTSSTPVRRTSTTLDLPVGVNHVSMLGRAAPDGIGTYYITFSGDVESVSGAATSGDDLTPGTVKKFALIVAPRSSSKERVPL